jgi:hypothetical protein
VKRVVTVVLITSAAFVVLVQAPAASASRPSKNCLAALSNAKRFSDWDAEIIDAYEKESHKKPVGDLCRQGA